MQILPDVKILPTSKPYLTFSGMVTNADEKIAAWDMSLAPYCGFVQNSQLPIRANILDSPRWKGNNKPVPRNLTNISAEGWLYDTIRNADARIEQYVVSVQNITFFGKAQSLVLPATPSSEPFFSSPLLQRVLIKLYRN